MKDFVDDLVDLIIQNEMPKVDKIMQSLAERIEVDIVMCTYMLLDMYYSNYTPEHYIRTDTLKKQQPRGKNGKFTHRKRSQQRRAGDRSLRQAVTSMKDGDFVIGVARGSMSDGYIAGVAFNESDFSDGGYMLHSIKGISEWDIINNFLFSASDGVGNHPKMQRSPEADAELINYINNYKSKFDQHYKDVLDNLV